MLSQTPNTLEVYNNKFNAWVINYLAKPLAYIPKANAIFLDIKIKHKSAIHVEWIAYLIV